MYQEQLNVLKSHLRNYRAPFKHILDPRDEGVESSGIEVEKQFIEMMNDPLGRQIFEFETKAQSSLDPIMSWLASATGYGRDSEADFFYHLLNFSLFIYFLLTMMSSFARPDFLNLTIISLFVF